MTLTKAATARATAPTSAAPPGRQVLGAWAALYLALALLGAMPYFLLVVDYPSATTAADKVALVVDNYASLYAVYIATYVLFGMAVGVLALASHDRLESAVPATVRLATALGLLWSFALVISGMVFTYVMTTIVDLHWTNEAQATQAWQAIEPVAMALGGAGGELLGGMWVLALSLVALRAGALPRVFSWLGLVVGVLGLASVVPPLHDAAIGLASVVPPLHDAAIGFGLLQIAWFLWIAWILGRVSQRDMASGSRP